MGRKVFISFLGTNQYVPCNYLDEQNPSRIVNNVQYVQEAIYKLYLQHFTENDKIYVFLTAGAYSQNWLDDGQFNAVTKLYDQMNKGLQSRFYEISPKAEVIPIFPIPEGYTTAEIWQIFNKIFDVFEEGDKIYFDITHGFRSLPMLGMTLIQYASTIKNIEVTDIFYGAFEKLGFASEVKKMPIEARNAPILSLSSFVELQKWTIGAEFLIESGNPRFLNEVMSKNNLGDLAEHMINFSNEISTCRLQSIITGNEAVNISDMLIGLSSKIEDVKPMKPIIKLIGGYYKTFNRNSVMNGIKAVKYCIDMGLVQQGYTLMSEFLTSYVCYLIEENHIHKNTRGTVNAALSIGKLSDFRYSDKADEVEQQKNVINKLSKLPYLKKLKERNRSINANNRDDINHAGMRDNPMQAISLEKELGEKYEKLLLVIQHIESQ